MFTGSYPLSVDDKGRIAIPSRVRAQLVEQHGPQLFITRGPSPSIEIYPAAQFHALAQQIQALADRKKAEVLKKIFIGHAHDIEIDKQGRILLPSNLREHARIKSDARLVGQITRIDLWAEDVWVGEGQAEGLDDAFAALTR
jgi:MraZ protein